MIGQYFVKHHRYTCPKLRFIWISDDLKSICWSEPQYQKTKVCGQIDVKDIKTVKNGIQKAKQLPKPEQSRYNNIISLITNKRTLEIETNSAAQKDQWMDYISILLKKNGIAAIKTEQELDI